MSPPVIHGLARRLRVLLCALCGVLFFAGVSHPGAEIAVVQAAKKKAKKPPKAKKGAVAKKPARRGRRGAEPPPPAAGFGEDDFATSARAAAPTPAPTAAPTPAPAPDAPPAPATRKPPVVASVKPGGRVKNRRRVTREDLLRVGPRVVEQDDSDVEAPPLLAEPQKVTKKKKSAEPDERPLWKKPWFWATVGGGVAVTGLAIGLGVGLSRSGPPQVPTDIQIYDAFLRARAPLPSPLP